VRRSVGHLYPPRSDRVQAAPRYLLHPLRPVARFLIRRRYTVRVTDPGNVPASGPIIYASNHVGVIDGPLLAIFAPRPAHALTKIEMFKGFLGRFLWALVFVRWLQAGRQHQAGWAWLLLAALVPIVINWMAILLPRDPTNRAAFTDGLLMLWRSSTTALPAVHATALAVSVGRRACPGLAAPRCGCVPASRRARVATSRCSS